MKHFFEANSPLDDFGLQQMLKQAREELRKKSMGIGEMHTKSDVICVNATSASEYVPQGFEGLLVPKGIATQGTMGEKSVEEIRKLVEEGSGTVLAYVLASVQTKEVKGYFDSLFSFPKGFDLEPQIITHVPDGELVYYLKNFLEDSGSYAKEGQQFGKKVEVFQEGAASPWKTLEKPGDLNGIEIGKRPPAILQRAFFSDVKLNMIVGGMETIKEFPLTGLRKALGSFNKKIDATGKAVTSKSSLYLKWKDIDSFKLASNQDKALVGLSTGGNFVPMQKFIPENLAGRWFKKGQIDFFRIRQRGQTFDLTPEEILEMEANLETSQMILTRGVGSDEFHVARFNRLRLYRGAEWVTIHKVIPFNRGESNFDLMLRFVGSRYTEYEKVRQIRKGSSEYDLLRQRKVVAGDLVSQLVLSSMRQLGVLTLEAPCLGFGPADINNPLQIKGQFLEEDKALKELFGKILDLSDSPNFTEHNFKIRTRNIRAYLDDHEQVEEISSEVLDLILQELEELTQYMDDFFKLNIYNRFQGDLEVDAAMDGLDEEIMEEAEEYSLDPEQKDFIADNFHFFRKREHVRSALLKVERMRFFQNHMKHYIYNEKIEPELVVYATPKSLVSHYNRSAYPAFALSSVLTRDHLQKEDEEEDLAFVQFMRGFTDKVYHKAQEINQSFHHQYKHTLAELTFLADEHLMQLREELTKLEDPNNKEKAYQELFEKIKAMFHKQLDDKAGHIEELKREEAQNDLDIKKNHQLLQKLMNEEIAMEVLDAYLHEVPEKLEKMRDEVMQVFRKKRSQIVQIFNPFAKFQAMCFGYYQKVLSYMGLFQKALWIKRKERMLVLVKQEADKMRAMTPEQLERLILTYKEQAVDPDRAKTVQEKLDELTKLVKDKLEVIQQNNARGMFQDKEKEKAPLKELLDYYFEETEKLVRISALTDKAYAELSRMESDLFDAQANYIDARLEVEKGRYLLKVAQMFFKSPQGSDELERFLNPEQEVPREIREELGEIRAKMVESRKEFKRLGTEQNLTRIQDFKPLQAREQRRSRINETAKLLINFRQGAEALAEEIRLEKEDLEYMRGQEGVLEKVAMSKALPSTRILLKTQYIPLVEQEKAMLERANHFLGEIISKSKELTDGLVNSFFRKRHGFPQFVRGVFYLDSQAQMKSHTVRNIQGALMLWQEKFVKGCAPVEKYEMRGNLEKEMIASTEIIQDKIKMAWEGVRKDRFMILPPTMNMEGAMGLCRFKAELVKSDPRPGRSENSLVLVYVGQIDFKPITADAEKLAQYHAAIMSNIFINVDGEEIFNNRESIYEALIRSTFGASNDLVSQQVARTFLFEV